MKKISQQILQYLLAHYFLYIFIFVLIAAVDIYLYSDNIERNSITQVVIDATEKTPLVPWAVGFIMGALTFHFFDSYKQKARLKKDNYYEW